jgi:hypothetical protein
MSTPEKRSRAPKVKPVKAEVVSNDNKIDDPIDAIADEHIEGWTKSLKELEGENLREDDPIDPIADEHIEGWTKPLEDKKEGEYNQWQGKTARITYSKGPASQSEARTRRNEARLDKHIEENFQKDFDKAFEDELKKSEQAWEVEKLTQEVKKSAANNSSFWSRTWGGEREYGATSAPTSSAERKPKKEGWYTRFLKFLFGIDTPSDSKH